MTSISATSNTLEEKRRQRRHQLSADIQVVHSLSNFPLGQLVNVHQQGLLLMGNLLKLHSTHQISLVLPNSVNLHTRFDLGIECLWYQPVDSESELYWCGCSIIDKSNAAASCIEALINRQN